MVTDPHSHTARLRIVPGCEDALPEAPSGGVLVVGYRVSFATAPEGGTPVAAFAAISTAATATSTAPRMALISVERATRIHSRNADGNSEIRWEENHFTGFGDSGIQWHLLPVDACPERGFVIASGAWSASGYQAVLTRSVSAEVPFAPTVVAVHNANPHTGHTRW
ncbi:MAG: hypothetical protein JWN03_5720 [Nocardia sp.]|uniref:hypothetical protein n=1 Tax=Nocardia sp. TaxID=1821 RepID=UPI002611BCAF|nr:hypothetical protein [Nocardia sp.]MCU1645445.1 hypothetical protein [Nocardia sp.]